MKIDGLQYLREDELEMIQRAERATCGPWNISPESSYTRRISAQGRNLMGRVGLNDSELIAHSRTDIPELILRLNDIRKLLSRIHGLTQVQRQEFYQASGLLTEIAVLIETEAFMDSHD